MNHLFILFSAALCLLIACNNNKKPGEITVISEDGKTTAKANAGNLAQSAEAMQKRQRN